MDPQAPPHDEVAPPYDEVVAARPPAGSAPNALKYESCLNSTV
jgi:hypothetical protein